MKPKQLVILLIILAAAAGWAILANSGRDGDEKDVAKSQGDKLLPELALNSVAQVNLTGPETSVSLKKKDGNGDWIVVDRDNYPADFNKIRVIVKDISELEVVQVQKVGASKLGRLGLSAPDAEGSLETLGTKVEILDASGKELASLMMGKKYSTPGADGSAGSPTGRYVQTEHAGEAYVVSNVFWNLETDPKDWLAKDSFSVQKAKTVAVDFPESDADDYTLVRDEEGVEPKFANAKDGEEIDSSKATSVANAFSSASFVDVLTGDAKADEKTGLDKPTKFTIETFEDFKYEVSVGKKMESNRYPLTVAVSAEIAQERTPEPDETEEDKKARDDAFENTKKRLTEKLEKEKKLEGNVYLVESWVVTNVLKKRNELMKEEEAGDGEETGAPKPGAVTPAISVPPSLKKPDEEPMEEEAGKTSAAPEKPKGKITAVTPPISIKDAIQKSEENSSEGGEAKPEMKEEEGETPAPAPEAGASEETVKEKGKEAAKEVEDMLKKAAEDAKEKAKEETSEKAGEAAGEVGEASAEDAAAPKEEAESAEAGEAAAGDKAE